LSDPVPEEMIEQILEAARWAPSANNQQPWSFVVVRDTETRRQVADYATYYLSRRTRVDEAPLLIVVCGQVKSRVYRQFLHGDVAMAGMLLMLQAQALGLGTCWIGGLERDKIAQILKIPDYLEIVGMITVGFSAGTPDPSSRKLMSEIVHYDLYESPTFDQDDTDA
jgi:nitroreductase